MLNYWMCLESNHGLRIEIKILGSGVILKINGGKNKGDDDY